MSDSIDTKCPKCGTEMTIQPPNEDNKTAAERIIDKFGGAPRLSKATGIELTTIYRWGYKKAKRGGEGKVPARYHAAIWDAAKKLDIKLLKSDFVNL